MLEKIVAGDEFSSLLPLALLGSADPTIRIEIADLINTLYLYVHSTTFQFI